MIPLVLSDLHLKLSFLRTDQIAPRQMEKNLPLVHGPCHPDLAVCNLIIGAPKAGVCSLLLISIFWRAPTGADGIMIAWA